MTAFEDILDGYFPLRLSVDDLMLRRNLTHATLELSFAPIIDVPDLPHDAPAPLNIRSGRAGMIHWARLGVRNAPGGSVVGGCGHWQWFDDTPHETALDPMTRLAEPALVTVRPATFTHPTARSAITWQRVDHQASAQE